MLPSLPAAVAGSRSRIAGEEALEDFRRGESVLAARGVGVELADGFMLNGPESVDSAAVAPPLEPAGDGARFGLVGATTTAAADCQVWILFPNGSVHAQSAACIVGEHCSSLTCTAF